MRSQALEPYRRANRLSKRYECFASPRSRHIIAGNDRGPRRFQEERRDLLKASGVRMRGTPQFVRPDGFYRSLLLHHVNRKRDEDWPFGGIGCDFESTAQNRSNLVRPLCLHAPLGDRCGHGNEIMS